MGLLKFAIAKQTLRCGAGAVLGLSVYGCGAADDLEGMEGDSIASVGEAITPAFVRAQVIGFSPTVLTCPSSTGFLLGAGGLAPKNVGLQTIEPLPSTNPTHVSVHNGGPLNNTAEAVCSNVAGTRKSVSSSTSEAVVTCPTGQVAVGGGGDCDGSGRLYRSRPSPDDPGSTPRGWAAGCTSGPATAFAICVPESVDDTFASCRTERVDSSGTGAISVNCPANFTAISAGGYCGDNHFLYRLDLNNDLSGARAQCFGSGSTSVHAYAVCCG